MGGFGTAAAKFFREIYFASRVKGQSLTGSFLSKISQKYGGGMRFSL